MRLKSLRSQRGKLAENGFAELAQLVEHATENRSVRGPIPRLGTTTAASQVKGLSNPRKVGMERLFAIKTAGHVLTREILEELRVALEQFTGIVEELREEG